MRLALTLRKTARFQDNSVISRDLDASGCLCISSTTAGPRASRSGASARPCPAAAAGAVRDALEEHVIAPGARDAQVRRRDAEGRRTRCGRARSASPCCAAASRPRAGAARARRTRARNRRDGGCRHAAATALAAPPSSRGSRSGTTGARRSRSRSRPRARRPRGSGSGRRVPAARSRSTAVRRARCPRACRSPARGAGPTARGARAGRRRAREVLGVRAHPPGGW